MKLWLGNIIKLVFVCDYGILQYKKGLVSEQTNTSPLNLCNILTGGVDRERDDFLSLADQYGPGTIIELLL